MAEDGRKREKFNFDYWADELQLGLEYRRTVGWYNRWYYYEKMYRNRFGAGRLPFNLIYAMARVVVPHVYGVNPYINVTAVNPAYAPISRMYESIDNTLIVLNETELNNRTIGLDTFLYGVGINQVGYLPGEDQPLMDVPELLNSKVKDVRYDISESPGMPWEKRVKPKDFLVPFGTRTLRHARWAAVKYTVFTEDLKLQKEFKNKEISPTSMPISGRMHGLIHTGARGELLYTSYWEIHCARTKKIYYMPAMDEVMGLMRGDKFIREPEDDPAQEYGLPFSEASFNEDPDYFWATPDAAIIEPFATELTEIVTQTREHRRKAMVKFAIDLDGFEDGTKDKLAERNPDACQILYASLQSGKRMTDNVFQFQPHIPHDVMVVWFDRVMQNLREIYGASRNTMGNMGQGRRTAHEAQIAFGQQMVRFDDKRKVMAKQLAYTFAKKNALVSKHWGSEQVLPVLGYDGLVSWVQFKPNELEGQFAVRIDPESMSPLTKRQKRTDTMETLQLLAGFVAQGAPINIMPLLADLIRQSSWLDVMQLLPQYTETPVSAGQFIQAQQTALNTNENRIGAFTAQNAEIAQ